MRLDRPLVVLSFAAAIATAALTTRVEAQRGSGGGFGGGRGALQGPRPGSDMGRQIEKRYEDMGELKPVLKNVAIEKSAKDSLERIEKTYKERLHDYGKSARKMMEAARENRGSAPDMSAFRRLRVDAQGVQDEEYAEVRKLLAEDQRPTFDRNIADHRAMEEKREAEQRERMEQGGGRP
jgi:hypothetical protein